MTMDIPSFKIEIALKDGQSIKPYVDLIEGKRLVMDDLHITTVPSYVEASGNMNLGILLTLMDSLRAMNGYEACKIMVYL